MLVTKCDRRTQYTWAKLGTQVKQDTQAKWVTRTFGRREFHLLKTSCSAIFCSKRLFFFRILNLPLPVEVAGLGKVVLVAAPAGRPLEVHHHLLQLSFSGVNSYQKNLRKIEVSVRIWFGKLAIFWLFFCTVLYSTVTTGYWKIFSPVLSIIAIPERIVRRTINLETERQRNKVSSLIIYLVLDWFNEYNQWILIL